MQVILPWALALAGSKASPITATANTKIDILKSLWKDI
jgi:hypothetical protein